MCRTDAVAWPSPSRTQAQAEVQAEVQAQRQAAVSPPPLLCVSIHDVAPATWDDCARLAAALREVADIPLSWLVVPRYHDRPGDDAAMRAGLDAALARGDELHPMQAAFIKHDGFQCGYCTPGQICSAIGLLSEVQAGTASAVTADVRETKSVELTNAEIKERMSGNICRCGAYPGIVAAVGEASSKTQPKGA